MTYKISRYIFGMVFLLATMTGISAAENSADKSLRCADIEHMLAKFDQAVEQQSVEDIVALMADDAMIIFKQPNDGREASMTRMEFSEFLSAGFQAITDFQYMRSEAEIQFDTTNNTATATFIVNESFTASNMEVHTKTRETLAFAILNKSPVITGLTVLRLDRQQREKTQ